MSRFKVTSTLPAAPFGALRLPVNWLVEHAVTAGVAVVAEAEEGDVGAVVVDGAVDDEVPTGAVVDGAVVDGAVVDGAVVAGGAVVGTVVDEAGAEVVVTAVVGTTVGVDD